MRQAQYLTREGCLKLSEKLDYLKSVKRREIAKAIEEARGHGDLSENAEYDAAKEELTRNERNIADLQDKLSGCRIIDDEDIPRDKVYIGATVKLHDLVDNEEVDYLLVSEAEADFKSGKISITSPIGRGLLGHKEGETVEITTPAGVLRYKIIRIMR